MAEQVQDGSSLRAGQAGGDVDDLAAQGGPTAACAPPQHSPVSKHASRLCAIAAQSIQAELGAEAAGGHVRQRPVDQVGEHGFDDGVAGGG